MTFDRGAAVAPQASIEETAVGRCPDTEGGRLGITDQRSLIRKKKREGCLLWSDTCRTFFEDSNMATRVATFPNLAKLAVWRRCGAARTVVGQRSNCERLKACEVRVQPADPQRSRRHTYSARPPRAHWGQPDSRPSSARPTLAHPSTASEAAKSGGLRGLTASSVSAAAHSIRPPPWSATSSSPSMPTRKRWVST